MLLGKAVQGVDFCSQGMLFWSNAEPNKGVLSLNKKDDASNSVFRFEAALTAVETEFVSLSVQSFLGDMKAAVKVRYDPIYHQFLTNDSEFGDWKEFEWI